MNEFLLINKKENERNIYHLTTRPRQLYNIVIDISYHLYEIGNVIINVQCI